MRVNWWINKRTLKDHMEVLKLSSRFSSYRRSTSLPMKFPEAQPVTKRWDQQTQRLDSTRTKSKIRSSRELILLTKRPSILSLESWHQEAQTPVHSRTLRCPRNRNKFSKLKSSKKRLSIAQPTVAIGKCFKCSDHQSTLNLSAQILIKQRDRMSFSQL